MINKEFFVALEQLANERKLDKEMLVASIEAGLASAYKKEMGESRAVTAKMNEETGAIQFYAYQIVVEGEPEEDNQLSLEEALDIKKDAKIGDVIGEDITPLALSRIAAQTAKQVILQRINEAVRKRTAEEMKDKAGELVNAIIRRVENGNVYVEIMNSQMEGVMQMSDQVYGEVYPVGSIIKVYVKRIRDGEKDRPTKIYVSRSCAGFVKKLFEIEVPELKIGLVKVKNIVREAGNRTKMAVYSDDPNIDAQSCCVGIRGERVNNVVRELNGEKIDIIPYSANPEEFIRRCVNSSRDSIISIKVDENTMRAQIVVADGKLAQAIGKGGANAKLASKLSGYKLDIKSFSEVTEGDE